MAEDVKPDVIKKTQDVLGKFIKKPTLTEKLLKKPPFRFLHDICTAAMKETGFLEDVLSNHESKIENITNKEGKIEFLRKVIVAVEEASGIKLSVKPNKIVAGLEATKTNEFLQALGKALEKQLTESNNSKPSQPTKTKSTRKTPKEVQEESTEKKKVSSNRSSKKAAENSTNDVGKNENQNATSPKKKVSRKKIEEVESKAENTKRKDIKLSNETFDKISSEKPVEEKPNSLGAGESKDVLDVDYVMINGVNGQGDQNLLVKEEVVPEEDTRKRHSGKQKSRQHTIQNISDVTKPTKTVENNKSIRADTREEKLNDEVNFSNKSDMVIKEQNRVTPSPSHQMNASKKDVSLTREGTLISRPRTGIMPVTARPASARPAAPRIRDRGEISIVEEVVKPASEKVQLIEEKDTNNEAEDENLISLETTTDILLEETAPILPPSISTTTVEGEHGHLVTQILEAQRELEDDNRFSEQKVTGGTEIEWESNKNKEWTNREIEKLRSNIQMLTRSVNPLGKLLDFFQEDLDIVQKELEMWREKNATLRLQIAHEKSITDQFLEPLKIHLKELQHNIDEELEKISHAKANIIRNNEKINKLLAGI